MLLYKNIAVIFFVLFLIISQTKVLAATDLRLPNTIINPDKYLFYLVKRLVEKAVVFTKLEANSKADYYRDLTLTRMAELKYVVENKFLGEVERSTQRLSYHIGILSDYIDEKNLTEKKQNTSTLLTDYKSILESLRDQYPANSSFWMLVQHSINSVDLNLEKLK